MVAEPADLAVTTPEVDTVATDVLLEDQVTVLLVALEGETVAERVAVLPSSRLNEVLSNETPVTETVAFLTVTEQEAVLFPSCVVQVIVAVPASFAVTTPLFDTVATDVLLDDHETPVLVALEGETVAVRFPVLPATRLIVERFKETPVTEIVAAVTETVHVAVLPPSSVRTVIVADPAALAVTTPLDKTVATEVLLEDHVTALLVALDGDTVAVRVPVVPAVKDILVLFRETPVTETVEAFTVTEQVAVMPPSAVLAVIVAVPAFLAVTSPSEDTVATEVLFDDHVTSLLDALEGLTVAVNHVVSPTVMERLEGESVTLVTGTDFTVIEHVAVLPPSAVLTVIVAEPTLLAVIVPSEATEATSGLLDVHVTSLFVAFEGLTVAVRLEVSPLLIVREERLRDTPVTEMVLDFTVTWHVA